MIGFYIEIKYSQNNWYNIRFTEREVGLRSRLSSSVNNNLT